MSARDFLETDARAKVTGAIKAVELRTSAELVVTVRKVSGHYGQADLTAGAVLMLVGLLVFLYHPAPFDEDLFPVVEAGFFVAGALLCRALPPLRRLLTPWGVVTDSVRKAACTAFVDQGISRTRDRGGVLFYVALFERRLEVVADVGVPVEAMGDEWRQALVALHRSVEAGDAAGFARALEATAGPLERAMPRSADDINELPDEVRE